MKNKKVEEVKIALIDLESEIQILQDAYAFSIIYRRVR